MQDDEKPLDDEDDDFLEIDDFELDDELDDELADESWDEFDDAGAADVAEAEILDDDDMPGEPVDNASKPLPGKKTFVQKNFNYIVAGIVVLGGALAYLGLSGGSSTAPPPSTIELPAESDIAAAADPGLEGDSSLPPMPAPMDSSSPDMTLSTEDSANGNAALTPLPGINDMAEAELAEIDVPEVPARPPTQKVPLGEPLTPDMAPGLAEPDPALEPPAPPVDIAQAKKESSEPPPSLQALEEKAPPPKPDPALAQALEEAQQENQKILNENSKLVEKIAGSESQIAELNSTVAALEKKLAELQETAEANKKSAIEAEARAEKAAKAAEEAQKTAATDKKAAEEARKAAEMAAKKAAENPVPAPESVPTPVAKAKEPTPKPILETQKPQPKQEVKKESATPESPVKTVRPTPIKPVQDSGKWVMRSAQPGKAVVSQEGSSDLRTVEVGDSLSGIGKITFIGLKDGHWIIQGTQNSISR